MKHKVIWLQPWCRKCERGSVNEGRHWCQDALDDCGECGKKPTRYVLESEVATLRKAGRACAEVWNGTSPTDSPIIIGAVDALLAALNDPDWSDTP